VIALTLAGKIMEKRKLGKDGPSVSALGYGLMNLSGAYGPSEEEASVRAIHRALEVGINFMDTAEAYGAGNNERLAGKALASHRRDVVLATKFGLDFDRGRMIANGRPENARRAIERSLDRLGFDHIDLYYLHRSDPDVPIEESVGGMARLVEEGKVLHLGLSGVRAETLERACREYPIAALQSEYSILHRDPEDEVLEACERLNVGFVAYSPLARGLLTGTIREDTHFSEDDFRKTSPRLQGENLRHNLRYVDTLSAFAREKELATGQLALAWLMLRGATPLFGTRSPQRIDENLRALDVLLDTQDLEHIDEAVPPDAIHGASLPEDQDVLRER